jgi:4-amino-4-deoxy-L-arabinose transferase-like glycosyltransferase
VSRRIPVETNARIPSPDNATVGQGPIRLVLALVWLGLFSAWFYSFGLPNNRPAERWMVWSALPFDLLDLLDPPAAEPPALPWSWLNLTQRLPFLGIACFIWGAATCIGRLELRALRLFSFFDRAERLFFAACLGLSTLSLIMLGFGLIGWMSRWPLLIVLLIIMVAELVRVPRTWSPRHGRVFDQKHGHTTDVETAAPANNTVQSSWFPWIVISIVTPFVFCMLLGAMSPQTDFDVIEYHLGGPKEWFLQGRITRLPHNVYTSFPFLTEMLVLSGMVLYGDWNWGALAGQAAIAGFAPLVAIGLYATARRWFSDRAGWFAALIWLTTPWVYRISIIAYAEGGLACYLFAAFAIALRIVWPQEHPSQTTAGDQPRPTDRPAALYGVCGFLAGSAMACKYTGLISVIIPVGLLLAGVTARQALQTTNLRRLCLTGPAFALGVLVAIGPWLLKNTVETGNPVFPLAYSIFGGNGRDAAMNEQWKRGHSSHYASLSDWIWDWPVKLTDVVANNDWHSVLMFAFAPIALLAAWRRKVWLIWAFIGWQFLTWFLFTHHIDRFYVPMFPVVALLAGCGACWLWTQLPGRWCGGLLIAASLAFNIWIMQNIGGFNAGRTDLRAAENLVVSPSQRWLNDEFANGRLPANFKVLCVGEAALFHAKFPYVYNTVFDRSLFEQCFADKSPAESREWLRQRGITHVLVNWSEILRYREPGSYGYTDFAHPDTFAKLQTAGLLGPALPLPDAASFAPVNDAKRQQVADWAPSLNVTLGDRPSIKAVQVFPVRL